MAGPMRIDRERASGDLRNQVSALDQYSSDHEKIILQTTGDPSRPATHRSVVDRLSGKLTGRLRSISAGLVRRWNSLREHDNSSVAPPRIDNVPEISGLKLRLDSLKSLEDPQIARHSIEAQALRQIYARTGVDAWPGYVHRAPDRVDAEKLDVKAIAFHLPEFYPIRGESEGLAGSVTPWTNISEALPRYLGHYQPHRPGELGFYDQRLPDILRQQVDLATQYGIYGFCFHYYWSEGRRLLEPPLNQFLSDASLNIRFCICWMNQGDDRTKADTARDAFADEAALIESLGPLFSDPRYIRIDGKPLLMVYRPAILPDALATARVWRDRAIRMGFPGLYLVASRADESCDPRPIEFDAAVAYPPHDTAVTEITSDCSLIDQDFSGHVFSYREVLEKHTTLPEEPFVNFKSVMTSWDDEPRRPGAGTSFAGSTTALYASWLDRSCRVTMARRPEERLIFINGWNNWGNAAHLEPDRKFGYAYLQASANILRQYQNVALTGKLIESINATFVPRSQTAIIFHCHYEDLIDLFLEEYLAETGGADLFVTVHPDISSSAIEQIRKRSSNVYFLSLENRGRDIRPFMLALKQIRSLGYVTACKIHTKKTPQATAGFGEAWRQRLIGSLLGSNRYISRAAELFSTEPHLGILAPDGSIRDLGVPEHHVPNIFWLDRLLQRMNRTDLIGNYGFGFPAGSMFWFRVEALAGFDELILEGDAFENELGQRDGTLAHAAERLVALYAQERGFFSREFRDYIQS